MIALTWQILLILLLAYFAGCIVGCLARKTRGAGRARAGQFGERALAPAGTNGGLPRAEVFVPPRPSASKGGSQSAFRRAERDAPSAEIAEVPVAPTLSPTPTLPPAAALHDDLTRIRAIDAALERKLRAAGVTRYADIAAWTSDQVKAISQQLGFAGRIERENWIEQAHILARGGETQYATKLSRSAPSAPAPAAAAAAVEAAPGPTSPPEVAIRAAFAAPRREAPPVPAAAAVATPVAGGRDNLQRIGGISAEIENLLNTHGATRYSQVAGWGSADVGRVEQLLGFNGRISRENWIEQAQILANGGATAYSRECDRAAGLPAAPPPAPAPAAVVAAAPGAPAPTPSTAPTAEASKPVETGAAERNQILSGMRSVRSEAYRDDSLAAPPSASAPDDLKRIRGIGILIETRLNAMGVTTYEQIANWTADDVRTVAHKLDFKGRIERENWIEQARILASGGQTDFSRRFERGEV